MQFQKTLVLIMESLGISSNELAQRMDSDYRWIIEITTNHEWKPKLDTIFRICYALQFDVVKFFEFVEFGVCSNNWAASMFSYDNDQLFLQNNYNALNSDRILETEPCHIAKAFRAFRLEAGLTQKELGQITLFSENSISLRESIRYRNYPTTTTLRLYCSAFEISLATFIRRTFWFASMKWPKNSPETINDTDGFKCSLVY